MKQSKTYKCKIFHTFINIQLTFCKIYFTFDKKINEELFISDQI